MRIKLYAYLHAILSFSSFFVREFLQKKRGREKNKIKLKGESFKIKIILKPFFNSAERKVKIIISKCAGKKN